MKHEERLFSVIVPVYNGERTLPDCLDSLEKQTCQDFEVLLIDDGSTDGSAALCEAWARGRPRQVRVFRTPHLGVSHARNVGLREARGEFLSFVDCDDRVLPDFLQCFRTMVSGSEDVDLAVCGVEQNGKNIILRGSRRKDGPIPRNRLKAEMMSSHSIRGFGANKVFRRRLAEQLRFDEDLGACEDLVFCIRYAQAVNRAVLDNTPNYVYVCNPAGASRAAFNPERISAITAYRRICGLIEPGDGAAAARLARRGVYCSCVNVFWMLRNREDYRQVRQEAGACIRAHPGVIFWPQVPWRQKVKAALAWVLTFAKE